MPEEISELKAKLVRAHKILYIEGVREFIMGHVSVRIPGTNNFLIPGHIHEIGRGIEDVSLENINTYTVDGKKLSGDLPDLDELVIHTAILKSRKDVNSVVHAHGPMTLALSIAGKLVQPINATSIYWGVSNPDAISMLDNDWPFITTAAHGAELVKALGSRRAVVHRGHAMVTVGANIEDACTAAIMIEHTARLQIIASLLGQPKQFSQKTVKDWEMRMSENFAKGNELWLYFENKLKKWEDGKISAYGAMPPL